MESKKLEALLMAVDLGSFTKAAEVMGYTQSGLTHMMNSLEREVGFTLLERGRGGVRLTKDGERESNILATIPGGSTISAPRTMIQYVATEYGIASLSGKTLRERAEAMASIAHPDFREELMKYARENFK